MDDWRDQRITTQIRRHILDGEPDGSGGHRYGTNHPGRTEFPRSWGDKKCLSAVTYTLDHYYQRDDCNPNFTKFDGYFDGVRMYVRLNRKGQIETAHPIDGEGVVRNDKRDGSKKKLVPLGTVRNVPLPS